MRYAAAIGLIGALLGASAYGTNEGVATQLLRMAGLHVYRPLRVHPGAEYQSETVKFSGWPTRQRLFATVSKPDPL